MANLKIKTNLISKIRPEYDPQIGAMAEAINAVEEIKRKRSDDKEYVTYYNVDDTDLSIDIAKLIVSKGGDVENFPIFIDTSIDCPFSFTDEEDNTVDHTWETWKNNNHTFLELADGKTYIQSSANTNEWMKASELVGILDSCIDINTVKQLQPVSEE